MATEAALKSSPDSTSPSRACAAPQEPQEPPGGQRVDLSPSAFTHVWPADLSTRGGGCLSPRCWRKQLNPNTCCSLVFCGEILLIKKNDSLSLSFLRIFGTSTLKLNVWFSFFLYSWNFSANFQSHNSTRLHPNTASGAGDLFTLP